MQTIKFEFSISAIDLLVNKYKNTFDEWFEDKFFYDTDKILEKIGIEKGTHEFNYIMNLMDDDVYLSCIHADKDTIKFLHASEDKVYYSIDVTIDVDKLIELSNDKDYHS